MADLVTMPEWELVELHHEVTRGFAVWQKDPGSNDEDAGEPVCYLFDDKGSHYEPLINHERNGLLLAASPQLLRALLGMIRVFNGPSKVMGAEAAKAIADAFAAARLTLTEQEQEDELDAFVARMNGEMQ